MKIRSPSVVRPDVVLSDKDCRVHRIAVSRSKLHLGEAHKNENKKQCSRQLQCEVLCGVDNVINSSLFINSSLSSLSSTSYAIQRGGGSCLWQGGGGSRERGQG